MSRVRRREVRRQRGQAMPSVVAVVSVIAIVVALAGFFAGGDDDVAEPRAVQSDADATSAPTGSASPDAPRTAAGTAGRSGSGDGSPARATEEGPKAGQKGEQRDRRQQRKQRRPRPEPDTGPPDVYVEVYNNSSISGLAAATAAELQDAGWQVVGVDNWRGDIPASTVYYPAGFEEEARELAETIGIDRLHGAVAPMRFDRLTVILTPDAA